MTGYMTIDTNLPPYFLFPWFLLDMDLSFTAKLAYALLLDRARLSQLNEWTDEDGRIYVIFPVEKMAGALSKGPTATKSALRELEEAGLIERRRQNFSMPNRIYVKLPDGQKIVYPLMDKNLSIPRTEKRSDGRAESRPTQGRKASTSKTSNIKTNISKTRGVNTRRFPDRYDRDYSVDPDDVV